MTPVDLLPQVTAPFPQTITKKNLLDLLLLNRISDRGILEIDTTPDEARRSFLKLALDVDAGDNNI